MKIIGRQKREKERNRIRSTRMARDEPDEGERRHMSIGTHSEKESCLEKTNRVKLIMRKGILSANRQSSTATVRWITMNGIAQEKEP
jgi:hypothetical protein